jgi:hypothetical protein
MVGPPFNEGAAFLFSAHGGHMGAGGIAAIVLVVLFLGAMTGLMIYMNRPEKGDFKETGKQPRKSP